MRASQLPWRGRSRPRQLRRNTTCSTGRQREVPKNHGTPPPFETVDICFRNKVVVRGISPKRWRWTLNDPAYPPNYDFDIIDWQLTAKG